MVKIGENIFSENRIRVNIRNDKFSASGTLRFSGLSPFQYDIIGPFRFVPFMMKLTLEQKIAHNGHPILRWMMDNVFIRRDPAGNIKPDKEKSTEKIGGAAVMIMALDRAIRCGNNTGDSNYDSRDMLVL